MAIQAHATAKYVRTSAQKAGLVLDLIRGRDVNHALATLRFARKGVARDVEKVLRSAIANAQQKDGFGGDVDRLYVQTCYANQGPSQKRIRPAPMGRAFRVVKRTAHLTVQVAEHPAAVAAVTPEPATGSSAGEGGPKRRAPRPAAHAKAGAKKKVGAGKKKKTAAKARGRRATGKRRAAKKGA
jgi:large subunit ribosomal protein L22